MHLPHHVPYSCPPVQRAGWACSLRQVPTYLDLQAELARRQAAALQAKLEKAAEDAESRRVAEEGRLAEQHENLRLKLQQAQADRSAHVLNSLRPHQRRPSDRFWDMHLGICFRSRCLPTLCLVNKSQLNIAAKHTAGKVLKVCGDCRFQL